MIDDLRFGGGDMTEQQTAVAHLADLMALERGLTAWEIEFIESVHA